MNFPSFGPFVGFEAKESHIAIFIVSGHEYLLDYDDWRVEDRGYVEGEK